MTAARTDPSISSVDRDDADPQQTLATFGKSFYWASTFFDHNTATDIAILYRFCRKVDDIADHQTASQATRQLQAIRADLDRGASAEPFVGAFLELCQRTGIDLDIPRTLVDAIAADTGPVQLADEDALVRYAYGVASTVGLMMCAVMGVREPAAQPFAVDLGVGMQLTNIARDVVEDAAQNRCYVPQSWFEPKLTPADICRGEASTRQQVAAARTQLLALAARYYRSADRGLRYIPLRGRLAVTTASRVYEAIGTRVQSPQLPWGQRAYVSVPAKVWHTARAISAIAFLPGYRRRGTVPVHDRQLHRALTGLPGTDGQGG